MPIIIPANSATSGDLVTNSLRFNDASSDYLSRTPSSAGNRQKWTWSAWIKRSVLGTDQSLFSAYGHANNNFKVNIADTDQLSMRFYNGSEYQLGLNRVMRDTSAWYHIVIVVDTTLSSGGDRFKIYINGVRESSFASANDPTQNLQMTINDTTATQMGRFNTGAYFDGYMAEVRLIDGQALAADSFGEFDEDSEIWKPIAVAGLTSGTNGFYLDFKDSGALGNDAVGSNNYTANNLAAVDQTTDTCINNFATMNILDNRWQGAAFSDGNLTVTTTNTSQSYNTSSIMVSSGKWYAECKPVSGGSEPEIGIFARLVGVTNGNNAQLSYNTNGYAYRASDPGSVWYNGSAVSTNFATYANGNIIGIALDLDNNKLYFSVNGTFGNSGNPASGATGTGAISIVDSASTSIGAYGFAMNENFNDNNKVFSWNFGNAPYSISSGNQDANDQGNFEYAVPTGYLALCTKNLSEENS